MEPIVGDCDWRQGLLAAQRASGHPSLAAPAPSPLQAMLDFSELMLGVVKGSSARRALLQSLEGAAERAPFFECAAPSPWPSPRVLEPRGVL